MHLRSSPITRRTHIARLFATAGGVGYSPWAPGTAGTIVAIPIAAVTAPLTAPLFFAVCAAVAAVGIWAAAEADRSWGTHDASAIVIDEVAGYLVAVALVSRDSLTALLAAFVLFRALDILKPPPIRWIDRTIGGGTGVVLDDIAAGVYAAMILYVLDRQGWLALLP